MKQKSFKQINRRRRDFGSGRVQGGGSKRGKIIGIIIASVVAFLLIAAIIAALVINNIITQVDPDGSLGMNNGNIIDNLFGGDDKDDETKEDMITSVQVVGYPDKRTYYCGELFDKTGLRVYAFYESGAYVNVVDDCTITGFDSSVAIEQQTLTVTYGEFTDTFTVAIKEVPKPVAAIQSVVLESLPKTQYKLGDVLEATGGVLICTYTDGTTKKVDLTIGHISGFKSAMDSGVGEHTLTVIYRENGVRVDTTYKITITQ